MLTHLALTCCVFECITPVSRQRMPELFLPDPRTRDIAPLLNELIERMKRELASFSSAEGFYHLGYGITPLLHPSLPLPLNSLFVLALPRGLEPLFSP